MARQTEFTVAEAQAQLANSEPWVVLWPKGVDILAAKDLRSANLGLLRKGTIVNAVQEGEWLALIDQRGFLLVEDQYGGILLEKAANAQNRMGLATRNVTSSASSAPPASAKPASVVSDNDELEAPQAHSFLASMLPRWSKEVIRPVAQPPLDDDGEPEDIQSRSHVEVRESFAGSSANGRQEVRAGCCGIVRRMDKDGDALVDFFVAGRSGPTFVQWVLKKNFNKIEVKDPTQSAPHNASIREATPKKTRPQESPSPRQDSPSPRNQAIDQFLSIRNRNVVESTRTEARGSLFSRIDANLDGVITRPEWDEALRSGIVGEAETDCWEVVWSSGVNIRDTKDRKGTCVGSRPKGSIVAGRLDGSWLALKDEGGFMLVTDPDHGYVLLEKRVATSSASAPSPVDLPSRFGWPAPLTSSSATPAAAVSSGAVPSQADPVAQPTPVAPDSPLMQAHPEAALPPMQLLGKPSSQSCPTSPEGQAPVARARWKSEEAARLLGKTSSQPRPTSPEGQAPVAKASPANPVNVLAPPLRPTGAIRSRSGPPNRQDPESSRGERPAPSPARGERQMSLRSPAVSPGPGTRSGARSPLRTRLDDALGKVSRANGEIGDVDSRINSLSQRFRELSQGPPDEDNASFDGKWDKGTIAEREGNRELTWTSGQQAKFRQVDSRTIEVVDKKGVPHTGVLQDDDKIHWSDGDLWSRFQVKKNRMATIQHAQYTAASKPPLQDFVTDVLRKLTKKEGGTLNESSYHIFTGDVHSGLEIKKPFAVPTANNWPLIVHYNVSVPEPADTDSLVNGSNARASGSRSPSAGRPSSKAPEMQKLFNSISEEMLHISQLAALGDEAQKEVESAKVEMEDLKRMNDERLCNAEVLKLRSVVQPPLMLESGQADRELALVQMFRRELSEAIAQVRQENDSQRNGMVTSLTQTRAEDMNTLRKDVNALKAQMGSEATTYSQRQLQALTAGSDQVDERLGALSSDVSFLRGQLESKLAQTAAEMVSLAQATQQTLAATRQETSSLSAAISAAAAAPPAISATVAAPAAISNDSDSIVELRLHLDKAVSDALDARRSLDSLQEEFAALQTRKVVTQQDLAKTTEFLSKEFKLMSDMNMQSCQSVARQELAQTSSQLRRELRPLADFGTGAGDNDSVSRRELTEAVDQLRQEIDSLRIAKDGTNEASIHWKELVGVVQSLLEDVAKLGEKSVQGDKAVAELEEMRKTMATLTDDVDGMKSNMDAQHELQGGEVMKHKEDLEKKLLGQQERKLEHLREELGTLVGQQQRNLEQLREEVSSQMREDMTQLIGHTLKDEAARMKGKQQDATAISRQELTDLVQSIMDEVATRIKSATDDCSRGQDLAEVQRMLARLNDDVTSLKVRQGEQATQEIRIVRQELLSAIEELRARLPVPGSPRLTPALRVQAVSQSPSWIGSPAAGQVPGMLARGELLDTETDFGNLRDDLNNLKSRQEFLKHELKSLVDTASRG